VRPFERGDHVELAARTLEALRAEGEPLLFDQGALHRYAPDGGLWRPIDVAALSRAVQAFAGAAVGSGENQRVLRLKASDVAGASKLACDQAAKPGFFRDGRPGLAFANGFACVGQGRVELAPLSPEHRATVGLPFAYDPCARYPRWFAFLEEIFAGDEDHQQKREFLQEFAGACLLGLATHYQRAVVLLGEGRNGKSVFIDVISAAFPAGARAAIAPQDWEQEYRRAMLAGVRLNALSELPEQDILTSEAFKAIVAGDAIVGRHIRQAPFTFRPVAGHLFAANQLPGTSDLTEGFWRRLAVVRFNWACPPERQDTGLAARIVQTELAGVVGWMLEGAARLLTRGQYEPPPSSTNAINEWRQGADSVGSFVDECTTPAHDELQSERGSRLYQAYKTWASACGFRPVSSKKFATRMKALGRGGMHTRTGSRYPVSLRPAWDADFSRP
jgi:putative DNA primase/helicase